jgi:hypothetical protein
MDASRFFSSSPESAAPDATHAIDKTKRIGSKMVRIGSSYVINLKSQSGPAQNRVVLRQSDSAVTFSVERHIKIVVHLTATKSSSHW